MWTPLWSYAYESTQLILNYAYKATQWICSSTMDLELCL